MEYHVKDLRTETKDCLNMFDKKQIMKQMEETCRPVVSVCCLVYNQEQFIRDCFDGFIAQKTNFPIEILIHDDASTDGSAEIINEYANTHPNLFKPIIQVQNQYSKGLGFVGLKLNLKRAQGKYIAFCEGDDYWIDPLKLQKQVDFLEKHEEYGFVGNYCFVDNNGSRVEEKSNIPYVEEDRDFHLCRDVFSDAKWGPVGRLCSLMFRKKIVDSYIDDIIGDIVLETVLAKYSYYACYNSFASVYRTGVGVSSVKHDFDKALRYNEYLVKSRLKQKELFPVDCPWDENELYDSTTYIKLKHSIELFRYLDAVRLKKQLKTNLYKNKNYAKRMKGFFSFVILFFMIKLKG